MSTEKIENASENLEIKKTWFRKFTRSIRPFKYSEDLLDNVEFRLNDFESFKLEPSINVEQLQLDQINLEFKIKIDQPSIQEVLLIEPGLLSLNVFIDDSMLKKRGALFSKNINDLDFDENNECIITIEKSEILKYSWTTKTKITLAIVLEKNRELTVGKPYLPGHWLAKKEIPITQETDRPRFVFEVVDPQKFKELGLPPDTSYFIKILGDDLNQPIDEVAEIIKIYLSKSVNNVLAKNEGKNLGNSLSDIIGYDLIATILSAGFSDLGEGEELLEDGILFTTADRAARKTGIDRNIIIKWAKEPGAPKLRAMLQSYTGLSKSLLGRD
jgi:hypothetical protein